MRILVIIMAALIAFSCTGNANNENVFYGAYSYKSGETLYSNFELNTDGTFNSWLHERPASSGVWSLKDDVITIKENNLLQKVKVIKIDSKEATFLFDGMKLPATFDKVE